MKLPINKKSIYLSGISFVVFSLLTTFLYQNYFTEQVFAAGKFCFAGICLSDWPAGVERITNGGWSDFGPCSDTCGSEAVKTRQCNNPSPSNGGADCSKLDGGDAQRKCNLSACPDSDGDGILDKNDLCPKSYYAGNNGCPRANMDSSYFVFDSDNASSSKSKEIYLGNSNNITLYWHVGTTNYIDPSEYSKYTISISGVSADKNNEIKNWWWGGNTGTVSVSNSTTYTLTLHGPGFNTVIGSVTANNPDSDNDGMARNSDRCPDRYGISSNDGCPANGMGSWFSLSSPVSESQYCLNDYYSPGTTLRLWTRDGNIYGQDNIWKGGCCAGGSYCDADSAAIAVATGNINIFEYNSCIKNSLRYAVEDYPQVTMDWCNGLKKERHCIDIAIQCNFQDVSKDPPSTGCGAALEKGYKVRFVDCY